VAAVSGLVVFGAMSAIISAPAGAATHAPKVPRSSRVRETGSTPTAVPQATFIEEVIPEGLGVLVNWDPNPSTDEVTSYKLTATVASGFKGRVSKKCAKAPAVSAPGTDSSALIPKLCAGIPYIVTMTASNRAGTGSASATSNPAVPLVAQPPSSPLITSVLSRNDGLVVNWSAPSLGGGDPLKTYVLTTSASTATISTSKTKATVTELTLSKLTNGTTYTLSLVAVSKAGSSAPGTSTGTPAAATPPDAPDSLEVVPDNSGDLVATWTAPADPGSSAVNGYTVTTQAETETDGVWSPTGLPSILSLGPTVTTTTVTGLSGTGFYTVSVAATSTGGTGTPAATTNPVTPRVQLNSSTVVLTQATMDSLASDDSSGPITWPAPAPAQVTSLSTGDILVGPPATAAPDGLLAAVTGVTDTSGTYVVTTTTASLADAFSDISFGYSGDPLAQTGSTFQAKAGGVRAVPRNSHMSLSLGHNFAVSQEWGAFGVTGQVNLDANVSMSAEVQSSLNVPISVSLSASASVSATASLDAALSGSKSWEIGEIDSPPIDVQAGPVPIVLFPKIPVFVNVSGQISVGVSASMMVGAGLSWSSENPSVLKTINLTTDPHMDGSGPLPGVSATATGTIELEVQPQIGIYDLAGPNVEADADLTATVDFLGSPYFTVAPSIVLKAGLDFDIAGGLLHGSLDVTLGTFDFPSFVIASVPHTALTVSPADPSVAPGIPTTFTATPSSGPTHPVKWYLKGAANGDSITSGGVLNTAEPSGRTLTVVAVDSTGAVGKTTVTVGTAFDPPGDLVAAFNSDGRSATVSWSAPENTGGTPIASYTVITEPPTATQTVSASTTSIAVNGLTPTADYVIEVYAIDISDLESPPATVLLVPTMVAPQLTIYAGIDSPEHITAGPDGALWFTNEFGNSIGRITTSGQVTSFTGTDIDVPDGIAAGPDGALWFANGGLGSPGSIGRITTSGQVTNFTDSSIDNPVNITAGPDGALWFTDGGSNSIGRITTSGQVIDFTGTGIDNPEDITAGPEGALWFTNYGDGSSDLGSIGRITTSGQVTDFTGPGIDNPEDITEGPDGALWFTNLGSNTIGRVTTSGEVTVFTDSNIDPFGITAGPDGALWFANINSTTIGRITTSGQITSYSGAGIESPLSITAGPDGALWFANYGNNSIGRITTSGQVTNFTGTGIDTPEGITAGPDGALWFANHGNNSIGRITTSGQVTNFTGTGVDTPEGITAGPDGALWFTNAGHGANPGSIGRITTSGQVTNYSDNGILVGLGTGIFMPTSITTGADGALWFTNEGNNSIGRITTSGQIITYSAGPGMGGPYGITAGPDGALWFTKGNSIGRITTAGVVTNFTDPNIDNPNSITTGPDGSLWFTNGDKSIGRITTTGVITNFTDPSINFPNSITTGPDGALWFTNANNNSIGRITTAGVITTYTGTAVDSPLGITSGPDAALWFTMPGTNSVGRLNL
jgi:streptogramin lyase